MGLEPAVFPRNFAQLQRLLQAAENKVRYYRERCSHGDALSRRANQEYIRIEHDEKQHLSYWASGFVDLGGAGGLRIRAAPFCC